MQKEFSQWNDLKPQIHKSTISSIYFHEREIWFIACGVNIGYEQDGKGELYQRPVLIIKKFNQFIFLGIPLTSREKNGKYYFPFQYTEKQNSTAILSQIKLFDRKRLIKKDGKMNIKDFAEIKEKVRAMI